MAGLASKREVCPANAGLYMAFKHSLSFGTVLAANFGHDEVRIMPEVVSKLLIATI